MPATDSIVDTVWVDRVERLSPAFARVWFRGEELADFGTPGETFDQRIKLVFPGASGSLPALATGGDWWGDWLAIPEDERGVMRTYSIRDLVGEGADRRLVVDFVLHLAPGLTGPAGAWASAAAPGDRLLVIGPRRGTRNGGIEFDPPPGARVVLAGDETAAPAIARILADSPADLTGAAFIEVPATADRLPLDAPAGVAVTWLPRDGAELGTLLLPAVLAHLGDPAAAAEPIRDVETEDLVWETPRYSGLGEDLEAYDRGIDGLYVWIAGESGVVTTLRRAIVRDLGVDRSQVAFMGYWRRGVAMRG